VILSSVRTKWPGFLKSQPRMNVAMTRCRKGMVVVTDKSFLQGKGKKTLLGQLGRTWSNHHDACWIDWKVVLNNAAALPGLPLLSPPPPRCRHAIRSLRLRRTKRPCLHWQCQPQAVLAWSDPGTARRQRQYEERLFGRWRLHRRISLLGGAGKRVGNESTGPTFL